MPSTYTMFILSQDGRAYQTELLTHHEYRSDRLLESVDIPVDMLLDNYVQTGFAVIDETQVGNVVTYTLISNQKTRVFRAACHLSDLAEDNECCVRLTLFHMDLTDWEMELANDLAIDMAAAEWAYFDGEEAMTPGDHDGDLLRW